jgi:cytochrome c oxidase subunit 2
MSITPPARIWWTPIGKTEKIWLVIAATFALGSFMSMPIMHAMGKHNTPSEYYKVTTQQFQQLVMDSIEKYKVGEEKGLPIVHPPPGGDAYLLGRMWNWIPILELEKGKTYRLHLSSVDLNHGLSIYPINMNFMAIPEYDYVIKLTPTTSGEFPILCNEYCGIGHHTMVGRIIVKE